MKRSRTRSRRHHGRTFKRRSSSFLQRNTLVSRALLHRPPTPPPARSRQSSRNDAYQPRDDRPRHSSDDQPHHGGQAGPMGGRHGSKGKKGGGKGKTGKQKGKGFGNSSQRPSPQKLRFSPSGLGAPMMMDIRLAVRMLPFPPLQRIKRMYDPQRAATGSLEMSGLARHNTCPSTS